MPFQYTIHPERKRVDVVGYSPSNLTESLGVINDVAADPLFQPHFDILVDLRKQDYTPSRDDVFAVQKNLIALSTTYRGHIAILHNPGLRYSLARMVSLVAQTLGHIRIEAFHDPVAAEEWIGKGGAES